MEPKYPIYIVSKGRWDSRLTSKALEEMNLFYYVVIEEQEYDQYAAVIDPKKLLILPKHYLEIYDACDDLGMTKSKGPGAARNFAWDHSEQLGAVWHWVMDDNFRWFYRYNHNRRIICKNGSIFRAAEDFCDRYENIYQAGFQYRFLCVPSDALPPYVTNTRIYSCILNRNNIPFRWRGRYNEDTDLSLRILKAGYCTVLFNAFLCGKVATQTVQGGNTKEFYAAEGTLPKSQMLVDLHPDVTTLVKKYNRWHHYVNYLPFKKNKLRRKSNYNYTKTVNEYGMNLIELKEPENDSQED